jgi:4-hydroxybenzoyl-CoA reductase subunit alpha
VIQRVDTAYTPCDPGSYGSRVTVFAGQATKLAAADVKRQVLEVAAKTWNMPPEEIQIRNSLVSLKSNPDKNMTFENLAKIASYSGTGAVILGKGYSSYPLEKLDFKAGMGNGGTSYSFTAQATRLGVDLETGHTTVTDFVIAHDCGRPLNPIGAETQNEGGAVQGLGQAIYEDFIMDHGETLNSTFLDYKMPRSGDVPDIKVIDIITDDPDGVFGAKEASEGSHVSTPPSVVSAIHDATGVWFKEQPVTPEKIWRALKQAEAGEVK